MDTFWQAVSWSCGVVTGATVGIGLVMVGMILVSAVIGGVILLIDRIWFSKKENGPSVSINVTTDKENVSRKGCYDDF